MIFRALIDGERDTLYVFFELPGFDLGQLKEEARLVAIHAAKHVGMNDCAVCNIYSEHELRADSPGDMGALAVCGVYCGGSQYIELSEAILLLSGRSRRVVLEALSFGGGIRV